jgi:hypothetical protein
MGKRFERFGRNGKRRLTAFVIHFAFTIPCLYDILEKPHVSKILVIKASHEFLNDPLLYCEYKYL